LTGQEVNKLSAALSAKDLELGLVKSSLAEVSAERDDLKIMLHEAQARVLELEEEIEGLKKPAGTTSTSASTSTSTSASLGSTSVSSSSAGR
jgi:chromosome segregation ATPase